MTAYRFRALSGVAVFVLVAFAVLAFGGVDTWALTIFELGIFVLAAVWAVRVARGSLALGWSPLYLPWGVVALWTAVQYALGLSVHRYRTLIEALKWFALWLLLLMATHVFTDDSIRRRFTAALIWFGFGVSVFGLIQHFTAPNLIYWQILIPTGRVFGPFVNGNHFAAFVELIVPAALVLALRPSERRLIHVAVVSLILAAVVVCGSRAGAVVVGLETLIVLVVSGLTQGRPRSFRGARVLLPVAGVAAAAAVAFYVAGSQATAERFQEEQPYALRWSVVQATWRLFLARPWTGYGAGTFKDVYPSATPTDSGLVWSHAHNDPIQFLMEWGCVAILVIAYTSWLILRGRWPQEVWLTVVLPLLAVLAHSWFDFPLQIPAVLAAWLLMLAQVGQTRLAAHDREPYGGRTPAPEMHSAERRRTSVPVS